MPAALPSLLHDDDPIGGVGSLSDDEYDEEISSCQPLITMSRSTGRFGLYEDFNCHLYIVKICTLCHMKILLIIMFRLRLEKYIGKKC